MVVVHPALHRHARLRVRVRVRPAARAVGLRAVRGRGAPTSCRSTSTCCARADRWRPRSSASIVDVDLADPGFWDRGLDIIERRLDDDDRGRARPSGRLRHDVPRHPVEHRQRRPARAALHHRAIPTSSSSALWVHSRRQGRARTRASCAGLAADRRARDQRRRRAARARRRLRVLHRDRRPAPGGRDQRHGAHPRVGQERRVELGRRR